MINKATLLGRIGKKEKRTLKNGNPMVMLSMATNRRYYDASQQLHDVTTWHNINCFNKLAEIADKYLDIGHLVYIEGEINHKKSDHGEHEGQYFYSITANQLKLLPNEKKQPAIEPEKHFDSENIDDDIPF